MAWKGKRIFLYFERTHWLSSVYVGKEEVSKIDYISIPHNHELTQWLHPGKKELITFCIDNRYQYDTHKWTMPTPNYPNKLERSIGRN